MFVGGLTTENRVTGNSEKRGMLCLSAIREGRRWLDDRIATHMAEHFQSPPDTQRSTRAAGTGEKMKVKKVSDLQADTDTARSEYAYHVAEFFYVARELKLLTRERLPLLIARHNEDMNELLKYPDQTRARLGIGPERVEGAIFSQRQQDKIFRGQDHQDREEIHLDQSDLGNLLSPLMATENCRQVLSAMAKGGLLKRWGYTRIFVSSPGILEDYFEEHLLMIDRSIRGTG